MKTSLRLLLLCVALPVLGAPTAETSPTFELVSALEAAAWNDAKAARPADFAARQLPSPGVPNCRALPDSAATGSGSPQIKILQPALGKPLSAPLDIELQFVAAGAAAIRPETFHVCYLGFITMDITQRITERVTVSAQGLHVTGANLPHGHHHLVMLIADQQGHFGRQEAVFDIE